MSQTITIIVPTRERADVLRHCLRTLAAQNTDKLKVIVSDNASSDETRNVYESVADERFTYIRTSERVSMSDNWDFALSHVSSGFIGFMGDDDGIIPGAIERLCSIISDTKVKAVRTDACSYCWPGSLGSKNGKLLVPTRRGQEVLHADHTVNKVIWDGIHYTNLPVLYNGGIVEISIMNSIKQKFGRFFSAVSPDLFSGFAISSYINHYIYSYRPEFVNGASKHSTGTAGMLLNSEAVAKQFLLERNMPYHPDIPMSRNGTYPPSITVSSLENYLRVFRPLQEKRREIFERTALMVGAERSLQKLTLNDWVEDFCALHNLSPGRPELGIIMQKIIRTYRSIKNEIALYDCGAYSKKLDDVFDASMCAGEIVEKNMGIIALKQGISRVARQAARKIICENTKSS